MDDQVTINGANGDGLPDADTELRQVFADLVTNVVMSRESMFTRLMDPRRNVFAECGWPESLDATPQQYRLLYDREPIANRVVQLMPKECWIVHPEITSKSKEFLESFKQLGKNLGGTQSWFESEDEKAHPVWNYLELLDILSGIGHFGVMLLGINDGAPLDSPLEGVVATQPVRNARTGQVKRKERLVINGKPKGAFSQPYYKSQKDKDLDIEAIKLQTKMQATFNSVLVNRVLDTVAKKNATLAGKTTDLYEQIGTAADYWGAQLGPEEIPAVKPSAEARELMFLRPFSEDLVQVVQWEANLRNPRFGQPVMYLITLNDTREQVTGVGQPLATMRVHWSRVIHLPSDEPGDNETVRPPRLRAVLNPCLDIQKIRGGSAEGFWKGAFPGISLETHPTMGGDVNVDVVKIKRNLQDYFNSLQRALLSKGMTAKMLSPTVVDPTSQISVQIEAICIQKAVPIRVLKGSERGELSSAQDDSKWNDVVRSRHNGWLTPRAVVPFMDRMIACGCLVEPPSYGVKWPDLESLSDADKAKIAQTRTATLATYIQAGVENLVPPLEFFTKWLKMTQEEAEEVLEATMKASKEGVPQPSQQQATYIAAGAAVVQAVQAVLQQYASGAMDEAGTKELLTEFFLMDEDHAQILIDGTAEQEPEPTEPPSPVKVRPGESLMHPQTGEVLGAVPTTDEYARRT